MSKFDLFGCFGLSESSGLLLDMSVVVWGVGVAIGG